MFCTSVLGPPPCHLSRGYFLWFYAMTRHLWISIHLCVFISQLGLTVEPRLVSTLQHSLVNRPVNAASLIKPVPLHVLNTLKH